MNYKPFIHLYRSPRGFYFYDVNKDCVVDVNESVYDYLGEKKSFEEISADDQNYVNDLIENGYLSNKRYSEIKHPSLNNLEYEVTRKCAQLILQVTQACNLVCSYCPYANVTGGSLQRDHSNKMMTWETAKKAIDLFFEHSIDRSDVSLSFYGGEPIIAFDLIKKCVEYAKGLFLGKELRLNMTTNATLLTDEIIDYLYENDFRLLFSIDGPEEIHDINRRRVDGTGSFRTAFANLKKVAEKYSNKVHDMIGINTVINPENDADLLFSLYDDEVFSKYPISVQMSIADDIMLKDKIEMTDLYREKINYQGFLGWLDHLNIVKGLKLVPAIKNRFAQYPKQYASFKKVIEGRPDVGAPGGPCVPGQRRIFVNADGNIYPCERVSETIDVMCIGNINDGIDIKKAGDVLNVGALTAEKCKNCYASSKCILCAKDCVTDIGFDPKEKVKHCSNVCANFDGSIRNMIIMKEARTLYKRRTH